MMLGMKRIWLLCLLVTLSPAGFVSCLRDAGDILPPEGQEREMVPVNLSLHVGTNQTTKADVAIISEMIKGGEFRGIEQVCLIPFQVFGDIGPDAESLGAPWALSPVPHTLVPKANAYLYSGIQLPLGTASVLVYGHGPGEGTTIATKHQYGSLIRTGFENKLLSASELGFSPEPILPETPGVQESTPAEAIVIQDVLTDIMFGKENDDPELATDHFELTVYFGTDQSETLKFYWDENIGNSNLAACYEDMKAGGALVPGSGVSVAAMLTSLYNSVNKDIINNNKYEINDGVHIYQEVYKDAGHNTVLTYGDVYRGVKEMIKKRFSTCDQIQVTFKDNQYVVDFRNDDVALYPENYGLPSGSAVVRWTPSGYRVPLKAGLEGIAPISHYCYPPSLYYYVNTTIRTAFPANTTYPDIQEEVYNADNTLTWDKILEDYYTSGYKVSTTTGYVALKDPLQFAVGMLVATVQADTDNKGYLQDNDGQDGTVVWLSDNALPLTGIIIGRQYPQRFDFTPIYHEATIDEDESEQYYLFDDQLPSGDDQIFLTETESAEFRTLSLETPEDQEAYFCLEFQNNSGQSFYGAEGRILPGHKFYLVGKLDFPEGSTKDKVFCQDCITTAHCVIKSLSQAYCAVPDMGIPTLALGVESSIYWELSSPTTIMLQ